MLNESKTEQTGAREGHSTEGPPGGKLISYRSPDGKVLLDVKVEKETVWLSQKQMALLFGKDADAIGLHIRNAFKEKELDELATTEESSVVLKEVALTLLIAKTALPWKDTIIRLNTNLQCYRASGSPLYQ